MIFEYFRRNTYLVFRKVSPYIGSKFASISSLKRYFVVVLSKKWGEGATRTMVKAKRKERTKRSIKNCYARRGVYVSNLSFVPIVSYFIDEPISLRNENNRLITSQAKTLVSIVRYKVRNVRFLSFRIILGIAV